MSDDSISIAGISLPTSIDQITARWLTRVLAPAYPGTEVKSVHIGTVIPGTATKVRLLLEYNDAGHRHRLPPTLWLKGGFIRHDHTYDESFILEAKFFRDWAPHLDINLPQSYLSVYSEEQHQGLVLLEDLCARNVVFGDARHPITLDQQAQTLELMARYHAQWWQSDVLSTIDSYSERWSKAGYVMMRMLEPNYYSRCIDSPRGDEVPQAYRDPVRVGKALQACWDAAPNYPHCFSHGDSHLGNMYFEQDGRPGFLDWQAWESAPFGHDMTYSIIGNLTIADRRASEPDLIRHYLEMLKKYGVSSPPGFDQAWQAYRSHVIHGFMWVTCPVEMQPEDICAANAHRFGAAVDDLDTFGALGV